MAVEESVKEVRFEDLRDGDCYWCVEPSGYLNVVKCEIHGDTGRRELTGLGNEVELAHDAGRFFGPIPRPPVEWLEKKI